MGSASAMAIVLLAFIMIIVLIENKLLQEKD
jgi:ABC-type sugar transport system permease subunit